MPKRTTFTYQPPSHGFIFGKCEDNYIIKPESKDGHIMIVGGVGSGKSSCIAMPTIRAWNSRIFAIDIKGELSSYASKYRSNIKIFSLQDKNACGYDPYAFLRDSTNLTQETKAIVQAIIPLPPEIKDTFWIESARLFMGGFIDMAEKTLSGVFAELSRHIISIVTDSDIVSALSSDNTIEPTDLEYGYDVFL